MKMEDITLEELVEVIRNIIKTEIEKLTMEDTKEKIKRLIKALKKDEN
jgi:hypothetical protein